MEKCVERRKCRRFEVPEAQVRFRKNGLFIFSNGLSKEYPVLNMSKGGLAFECDENFVKNEKLTVRLLVPDEISLDLRSLVRWKGWSQSHGSQFVGVEFKPFGNRRGWNPLEALDRLRLLDAEYGEDLEGQKGHCDEIPE